LKKDEYELVLHGLLREAEQLDQTKDPCDSKFIPDTKVSPCYYLPLSCDFKMQSRSARMHVDPLPAFLLVPAVSQPLVSAACFVFWWG